MYLVVWKCFWILFEIIFFKNFSGIFFFNFKKLKIHFSKHFLLFFVLSIWSLMALAVPFSTCTSSPSVTGIFFFFLNWILAKKCLPTFARKKGFNFVLWRFLFYSCIFCIFSLDCGASVLGYINYCCCCCCLIVIFCCVFFFFHFIKYNNILAYNYCCNYNCHWVHSHIHI